VFLWKGAIGTEIGCKTMKMREFYTFLLSVERAGGQRASDGGRGRGNRKGPRMRVVVSHTCRKMRDKDGAPSVRMIRHSNQVVSCASLVEGLLFLRVTA